MKHNESIIQSVPRWWAGGAMLRLCRTAVALIAIITRLRPTDFVGRAIILSACSLPGIFLAGLPAVFLAGLPAVFLAGCRKEAPPQPDTPKPGKRNYVWTIDSIDYGGRVTRVELESIWGSSATDIWGAAGDAPDVRDCLWHYDGVKWSRATDGTPITEPTGNKVVYAVWGSARNDVWACGRKINQGVLSAFLMHYDGSRWMDATPSNVSAISGHLYTLYGISQNDIWACGYEYAIHFNGTQWTTFKVADSMIISSIASWATYKYFQLYSPWGGDTFFIKILDGQNFTTIDYTTISQRKFGGLMWANDGKLITFTNGVITTSLLSDGRIDTSGWRREFSTATFFSNRFVQSPTNVFVVGQWNLLYHFNGTDWRQLFVNVPGHTVDPRAWFWGVWADRNEVFICDVENGIIYHGR